MAKNSVSEWDEISANNTDIAGVDINEGCAPSGINNAIRALMAQVKTYTAGLLLKAGGTMTGGLIVPKLASVNVTIADDAVYNVTIPFANGLVILSSGSTPASVPPTGIYWIRRSATAPVRVAAFKDTNLNLLLGTLNGTTGPDGDVNLSVANVGTVFQYENRSGAAQSVTMTFIGGA